MPTLWSSTSRTRLDPRQTGGVALATSVISPKCASIRSSEGSNPVNNRNASTAWNTAIPPPGSTRHPTDRAPVNSAVSNGDYASAVSKGQAVKDKATALMHSLGMKAAS